MKKTLVGIIILLVIIALGIGGYKLYKYYKNSTMMSSLYPNQTNSINPTVSPSATNSGLPTTGNSNADLNQDVNNIQGSMNNLNSDQNAVNQLPTSDQVPTQ